MDILTHEHYLVTMNNWILGHLNLWTFWPMDILTHEHLDLWTLLRTRPRNFMRIWRSFDLSYLAPNVIFWIFVIFLSYFANFHNFSPKNEKFRVFWLFFFAKYLTRFYKIWSFWTDLMWNIWNNGKRTQKYRWNSCFRNRDWLLFKMKPNKTDFLCFIWKFLRFFNVIFHLFDVIFRDFKCHKKDIFGVAKCHIITGPNYFIIQMLIW